MIAYNEGEETMRLDGKVAIVTGGAKGIGWTIAKALAAEGASLVIADMAGAEEAANSLGNDGHRAIAVAADVTSEDDMTRMAEETVQGFGTIDILVNNAGIFAALTPKIFDGIDADEWRKVMDINVFGVFLASRAVVGVMRKGGGGRIVNISSGVAFKGNPMILHYVASKGAVVSMTRAMARELGTDNILVNSVAPGFTLSQGVEENMERFDNFRELSMKGRALMRDQHPDDIAGAVVFFASAESAFITGQNLVVDGGSHMH